MTDRLNAPRRTSPLTGGTALGGSRQGLGRGHPGIITGVRGLNAAEGSDLIVAGSSTLTSMLLGEGLADEVVLCVDPVLLSPGKCFFSDRAGGRELAFVGTKTTPTGVLLNTYRHMGSLRTSVLAERARPSEQSRTAAISSSCPVPAMATRFTRTPPGPFPKCSTG